VGHIRNGNGVYGRLQKRLDRFPIGAPPAAALYEILKRLYTEEEAEVASRMPIRFTDLAGIARRTGKSPEALRPILHRMADKGLVMDFEHRGKFQNLLFDDFDRLDHAALRAVTRIVVGLPPVKKALLSQQVQSRFFRALAGK
jgi:hypothetical protein